MPLLPLIDLLILLGWTSLLFAFLLKAIWITTTYRPTVFGLYPFDFLLAAGVCLLFAMTLAARTWVKLNEPRLIAMRRRRKLDYEEGEEEEGLEPGDYAEDAQGVRRPEVVTGR
jgi:hypothetical protein